MRLFWFLHADVDYASHCNIGRCVRHSEEDNDFPAWLALECAASFLHRLSAGRAQRCHCVTGTSETANSFGFTWAVLGAAQASDSVLTTASIERKWINNWSIAATFCVASSINLVSCFDQRH
jgi:hypothetical protein